MTIARKDNVQGLCGRRCVGQQGLPRSISARTPIAACRLCDHQRDAFPATLEPVMVLARSGLLLIIAAAVAGLAPLAWRQASAEPTAAPANAGTLADEAQEARPNRIRFEYAPPQNPQLETVYNQLRQGRALEKIQQLFSPFRLPSDLTVKTIECGNANAWYQRPTVTLCYEYLDEIWRGAPKELGPAGVTPVDAVVGQFFYVVAHEFGHAMFDLLQVPSFGSA